MPWPRSQTAGRGGRGCGRGSARPEPIANIFSLLARPEVTDAGTQTEPEPSESDPPDAEFEEGSSPDHYLPFDEDGRVPSARIPEGWRTSLEEATKYLNEASSEDASGAYWTRPLYGTNSLVAGLAHGLARLQREMTACRQQVDDATARLKEQDADTTLLKQQLSTIAEGLPVVDSGKVLLRGVSDARLDERRSKGASALGEQLGGQFVRAWKSSGGDTHNVVIEVSEVQRTALLRAAKHLRDGGLVVAPYLTAFGRKLRKERQEVFNSYKAKGVQARWRGVEVEFLVDGAWMSHDFSFFG